MASRSERPALQCVYNHVLWVLRCTLRHWSEDSWVLNVPDLWQYKPSIPDNLQHTAIETEVLYCMFDVPSIDRIMNTIVNSITVTLIIVRPSTQHSFLHLILASIVCRTLHTGYNPAAGHIQDIYRVWVSPTELYMEPFCQLGVLRYHETSCYNVCTQGRTVRVNCVYFIISCKCVSSIWKNSY